LGNKALISEIYFEARKMQKIATNFFSLSAERRLLLLTQKLKSGQSACKILLAKKSQKQMFVGKKEPKRKYWSRVLKNILWF